MKVTKQQFMDLQSLCWDITEAGIFYAKAENYRDSEISTVSVFELDVGGKSRHTYFYCFGDLLEKSYEELYEKLSSFLPEAK